MTNVVLHRGPYPWASAIPVCKTLQQYGMKPPEAKAVIDSLCASPWGRVEIAMRKAVDLEALAAELAELNVRLEKRP